MTTGKTIALTRRTFVGKVMSLLFSMLSSLVIIFLPRSKHLLISWLQSPSAVTLEWFFHCRISHFLVLHLASQSYLSNICIDLFCLVFPWHIFGPFCYFPPVFLYVMFQKEALEFYQGYLFLERPKDNFLLSLQSVECLVELFFSAIIFAFEIFYFLKINISKSA